MHQSDREGTGVGRRVSNKTRPPLLKMTRALVSAALAQGQTRTAFELIGNGFRTARALPAAQQIDLAVGVVEEAVAEVRVLVFSKVLRRESW